MYGNEPNEQAMVLRSCLIASDIKLTYQTGSAGDPLIDWARMLVNRVVSSDIGLK